MKRTIAFAFLLIAAAAIALLFLADTAKSHTKEQEAPISISSTSTAALNASPTTTTPMTFEVVTTQAAQERGLGGRATIPDNYAMLFVFPRNDVYGFWMKDMLTSIDMIWLDDTGTIVSLNKAVPADSYPEVYYPTQPIRYVLETKAGFADEKGWSVGVKVPLPAPY